MIGSRAWRALMRRDIIYRRRNIAGSLFEFFLPIVFVGFLVLIKMSVEDSESFAPVTVPDSFPTNSDSLKLFSFTDYVTTLQAERKCVASPSIPWRSSSDGDDSSLSITGIFNKGYNWQVPFVKCDSRLCREDGQDAFPLCEFLALGVAPSSEDDALGLVQAEAFRDYIYNRYPVLLDDEAMPFDFEFVQMFESDQAVEQFVQSETYGSDFKLAMAVIFDGASDPTINYNYKLRVNSTGFNSPEDEGRPATTTTPPTDQLFETFARTDLESCPDIVGGTPDLGPYTRSCTGRYTYNGALTIQRLVHDFIISESGARDSGYYVAENGVQFVAFPFKSYVENGFYAQISAFAPLLITLGLLYPVAAMIRYIVLEKELRQKELMKMMSVKESDIGWSWFVFFFVFHAVTALGSALVSTQLYVASSPLLLFIFWEFTFLAIICFSFFLSSLFSKATRATLVSLLIFFVGYFLTLVADYQTSSVGVIFVIGLHPVGAFAFGLQEIGRLEDLGVGLTFDTITQTDSPNGYTFANTMSSFLFDALFWGILSWYLNRVAKAEFGRPLPWYFPFTLSYWCPGSARAPTQDEGEIQYPPNVPVEPVSTAMKDQMAQGKGIEIRKLTKSFGDKTAVDQLSMNIYSNQITALLGSNGAGKTTTISMLTGMLEPTSGYAKVAGKDIRTEMDSIRGGIGICLQHDCLFPELTVREHISFFARVKGLYAKLPRAEAEHKVGTSIQDVALSEKSNTLSKNLSGGMKRKLSVAIAFCGDSEVVLCDEPTSGMDPFSRRFTWNVLREYRKDRTIILTTHFMDEADILGDRIAIMAEGRLRCQGSSLFLKKTYGVGYQLTIEKQPLTAKKANKVDGAANGQDANSVDSKMNEIVKGSVPEATLLTNVGAEMSYQLPLAAASNFTPMFDQLDDQVSSGGIVTYGVGITTLDDVFLLVARGETAEKPVLKSAKQGDATDVDYKENMEQSARSSMDLETEGLFIRHVGALFRKRAMNFKRDKKAWCCTTILPSVFVLIGFLLYAFVSPTRELDALTLDLDVYNVDVTTEPRNPIVFSDSDTFSCQPGKCIYEFPLVALDVTNELYYYCGVQSYIGNGTSCSIESYGSTIAQITDAGAAPFATTVANVNESSYSLSDTASAFAATQYGAIFYHHDVDSVIVEDTNSASIFNLYFDDLSFGDIDITTLGPLLESAGINASDFNITALLEAGAELEGLVETLFPTNVDIVGLPYSEAAIGACLDRIGNYTSQSDCLEFSGISYSIQYNFTAIHVAPLYQTLADEALVREGTGNPDFKIKTTIHPLPITNAEQNIGEADDAFTAWFLIILGFPFISGSFATFVVQERQSKAKHLQTVAGVKPHSYWLSTWLWDVVNYQIPCWITVALMFIFSIDIMTTTKGGIFGGILALLLLFGPAAASFSYLLSFLFSSPSICNLFIIISSFLVAFGGTLATFILRLIGADPANPRESLTLAAEIVEWILRFTPAFCLGRGLYSAINLESISFLEGRQITVWDSAAILYEVIFLGCESVVYLLLAMKIDEWSANPRAVSIWKGFLKILSCQWLCDNSYNYHPKEEESTLIDDDVAAEEQRVLTGGANDDLIVLSQLTKVYDTGKKAVDSVSLGIPPGQCFGLLGINGAGKTTTMAMLTAEFPPTSGDATLAGFSVTKQPEKTRRRVGYCPQFDALLMNLTGREHVELYASIKGVPSALVKEVAALKLAEVGLSEIDSDRLAAGYSGGMKRRLSLATATIGNPSIVFLDECSTGVDPVARREIWAMISKMVSGGDMPPEERTSVILTTHSMEECEALCPRIGIMAGGKLRCLGSAQRLKNKFGQGYQIELKVKNVETTDQDYLETSSSLAKAAGVSLPEGDGEDPAKSKFDETFFTLNQAWDALSKLTGDDYLTNMLNENDPVGYVVLKEANSPSGIDLDGLAEFACTELRMRRLNEFITENYAENVLRERQDTKARYEVGSKGVHVGNIFASIEENKERLMVSEYGVSQTSLEQVFNMFAADAEKQKQGTLD